MKQFIPLAIFILALMVVFFSLYGDDSYSNLQSLKESYNRQKVRNADVLQYVRELKTKVVGIQNDERELEKAARNEFGLARENELIIVFEEKPEEDV